MTPAELRKLAELHRPYQPDTVYALRQAADTIETLTRERDEALQNSGMQSGFWGRATAKMMKQRDEARAQVETLTRERDEALRFANGKLGESAKDMMQLRAQVETLTKERDDARADAGNACVLADFAKRERDAARAQVDLLAKALRYYSTNADMSIVADEALKAAGLEEKT